MSLPTAPETKLTSTAYAEIEVIEAAITDNKMAFLIGLRIKVMIYLLQEINNT